MARTHRATAHTRRTESHARCGGVRLGQLHCGGARRGWPGGRALGDPKTLGTAIQDQAGSGPGVEVGGREEEQRGRSEGGEGSGEGGEGDGGTWGPAAGTGNL